jgi:membrane-associated phospholipid phosphatase
MPGDPPEYRPLIAEWLRWPALWAIAMAVAVTTFLAVSYGGDRAPGRVDATLDALAALSLRNEFFNSVDTYFIKIADATWLTITVALLALATVLARRWTAAVLIVAGTTLAAVLVKLVLKPVVGRYIGDVLSFPSTHVTTAASVAIALVVILLTARSPRMSLRIVASAVPLAVAATTTLAVVAEGTHYATDAVAAWCVAVAVVLSTALAIDAVSARRSAGTTVAGPPSHPVGCRPENSRLDQ